MRGIGLLAGLRVEMHADEVELFAHAAGVKTGLAAFGKKSQANEITPTVASVCGGSESAGIMNDRADGLRDACPLAGWDKEWG